MTKNEAKHLGTEHGIYFANCLADDTLRAELSDTLVQNEAHLCASAKAGFRSGETGNGPTYVAAFVNAARLRYNGRRNELPDVKAEQRRQSIDWTIEGLLRCAKDDLATFSARFAENPLYAFEWASGAIEAAAKQHVALALKAIVERPGDEFGGHENAVKYAVREALRGAKWPSHSTSAVSNLANEAKTAAFADFADKYRVDAD
jgi:hypothetical protein